MISLRDYQEKGVSKIQEAFNVRRVNSVLFVLPTGGGKCLGKGTPILMYDGTIKPVEDVVAGDLLMGPDSQPRRVDSLARGREMLYRVVAYDDNFIEVSSYVVNESHILSLRRIGTGTIWNVGVKAYKSEKNQLKRGVHYGWKVPGILSGDFSFELTGIRVNEIGEGDYYGFSISGNDRLFLLGDFTVTHNTYTFSYIAHKAAEIQKKRPKDKQGHIIIGVHRKELLLQASKSLRSLGIDHGMISPHFRPQPRSIIQVASVPTLISRLKKREYKTALFIVDEAHHVTDKNTWGNVYKKLGNPRMLGVTATPCRSDGVGLGHGHGGLFEEMVIGPTPAELIEMGHLINPEVYMAQEIPDYSSVKINADGEYDREQMAALTDKPKINGDAVKHYSEICPGSRAIVFCTNIKHAKNVVAEFNAAGFKFALLVGAPEMSDSERTSVNRRLESGELDGVVTVDLVSEGYDLPALECGIMLRRTNSEGRFLQQVGRIMRPFMGRKKYLLDHVGNVGILVGNEFIRKHGLPSEVRYWSLEGRKKKEKKADEEKEIKIRQCSACFYVHESAPQCPNCGFVYPVKQTVIEQTDGKLVKFSQESLAQSAMAAAEAEAEKAAKRIAQGKAKDEAALVATGMSVGRAAHIIQARQEKQNIISEIIADLTAWQEKTGHLPYIEFGVSYREIRYMKPKQLKELREKMDAVMIKPKNSVLEKIRAAGFSLTLFGSEKIRVVPAEMLSMTQKEFIVKNKQRLIAELVAESGAA